MSHLNISLATYVVFHDLPLGTDSTDTVRSETAWRLPACIFVPADTEQLQMIVTRLVETGTKFAIRSGGHSPAPQAANIDGGVLIDLSGFNEVKYEQSEQVATIGSGLTWGEVYSKLDPFSVTVVGGRVGGVGVGGLTTGGMPLLVRRQLVEGLTDKISKGGLSYLSDLYGLVCDNVLNFEV